MGLSKLLLVMTPAFLNSDAFGTGYAQLIRHNSKQINNV